MNPDISIIIVSYNVQEYLQYCIDSILMQKDVAVEIIVIDNNSTDGTRELLASKYTSVKVITNSGNIGFSAANNQGIKEASGNIIALLNPDTQLTEASVLQRTKKYLEENPGTAIMVPCLLNSNNSFQPSFWNYPAAKAMLLELFYLHQIDKTEQPSVCIPIQAASGAALFFRKSLINEIGYLDENMFWMEDVDFCYRANKAGKIIVWNPEIKIIHHGGKSSIGNESITIPNQVISKIKFSRKHYSKPLFYLINSLSLVFICSRLFTFTLLSFINTKYSRKRKAYRIAFKSYFCFNFKNYNGVIK